MLLAKPPSPIETVSDLNADLVTFWRVLRDQPAELARVCALTPHARAELRHAVAALRERPENLDDVERAPCVWVLLTQRRSAATHPSAAAGWRFTNGGGRLSLARYLDGYLTRLSPAAERLRRVSLECRPALELIHDYGRHPEVCLYVDPPYLADTRSTVRLYQHEMLSVDEHAELLDALTACRAAVVLSGYDHPPLQRPPRRLASPPVPPARPAQHHPHRSRLDQPRPPATPVVTRVHPDLMPGETCRTRLNNLTSPTQPTRGTMSPETSATADTRRLGTYWHSATFDTARRGYLADLDTVPHGPGSLGAWVDQAIRRHARLDPAQRAALVDALGPEERDPRGVSRSFIVSSAAIAELEAAIVADRRHGRVLSRGEFVSEAVRAAAHDAQQRYGGPLPPAPARLPNRPPRAGEHR